MAFMSVSGTHVRPSPLLACQFLLLGVGGRQLQVEHWLQSGGASVDPLAPLVVLMNSKQHAAATLHSTLLQFVSAVKGKFPYADAPERES